MNLRILILLIFIACQSNKKPSSVEAALPSDFVSFYEKFHQDSIYQMNHIIFPLEGVPSFSDSLGFLEDDFKWQKDRWIMHRIIAGDEFLKTYDMPTEFIIRETITFKNEPYAMQRRFAKINGDWNLIHYIGMNKLK